MRTSRQKAVRLLVTITLLWLVGVAFLGELWLLGVVLTIPGFITLALCARDALKGNWGSVAAWSACSLAPLAFLAVIAIATVHLREYTGGGPTCEYLRQNCDPQWGIALVHTVSLVSFIVVGIFILRLIGTANRSSDPL